MNRILQPPAWKQPRGYSNGIEARGRLVFVAGQVGWDAECKFSSSDFVEQSRQALRNIAAVLHEAEARPEHIVRMMWYVKDKAAYRRACSELGKAYREILGDHYPAMSLIEVSDLLEDEAVVEIEATAVVPD